MKIRILTKKVSKDFKTFTKMVSKSNIHRKNLININRRNENCCGKLICSAGHSTLTLDAKGDYYPCPILKNGFKLGNCGIDSMKSIWLNSNVLKEIRSLSMSNLKKCMECNNRIFCKICLSRNYYTNKSLILVDENYCEYVSMVKKLYMEESDEI